MGNTLQKILQRRGDKEGQSFRLRAAAAFLLLFLTYLGLLFELPLRQKGLWFIFGISTVVVCGFLHFISEEKKYSVEFLFSISLMLAGTLQLLAVQWLKIIYFPFLIALTFFYGRKTVIPLVVLMPFLELKNFLNDLPVAEGAGFFLSLAFTAFIAVYLLRSPERREKEKAADFSGSKKTEGDLLPDDTAYLHDEKLVSDYLEEMFKPDNEIMELLAVAKKAVFADSVNFFSGYGEGLKLRCSTDGTEGIIASDSGLITVCFRDRKDIVASDMNERKIDAGYLRKEHIASLVAVPVMDDKFPMGVITADSARFHAFTSADRDTLQVFANQIMRILQRERVYPQIHRSFNTLKILNEESSRLLSSLNIEVIAKTLIEGVSRITPEPAAFFLSKGREFELADFRGLQPPDKKLLSIKGTLIEMSVKNRMPLVISDVKKYRLPVMPFRSVDAGSIMALPLFYEKDLLGILVAVSEKTGAFSSYQAELLAVLGNQASASMANARFHAEIEKMAVTDGLTGLFNHRHFQERLLQEFKRLERFSEPMSLLLIDIDYFKKVNDTYGHPAGDAVLRGVAGMILKTIRNIDIAARYGGEEFAVILIGTDVRGARNMAERLRKTVENAKFKADVNTFNVTISTGISKWPDNIKSAMDFIERADKALYHAKHTGRNRSVSWDDLNNQIKQ